MLSFPALGQNFPCEFREERMQQSMKGTNRRHNNVASSCCRRREGNNISSSTHWRFKGRRKKRDYISSNAARSSGQRGYTGARCFQPHTGRNRRENQQKTTIAMVI